MIKIIFPRYIWGGYLPHTLITTVTAVGLKPGENLEITVGINR